jgi:protein-S-isoprenylcysteine O-methyltransferase Ste14
LGLVFCVAAFLNCAVQIVGSGVRVFNELAMMMVMMWPVVPMFLIQIHYAVDFWRKLGLWTYVAIFLEWVPVAFVLYLWREVFLRYEVAVPMPFVVLGVVAVVAGIALHGWTAKLLGIKATISYTELKPETAEKNEMLVTSGPFSVVRHPSYWAHTMILTGVFLITGVVAVGIIALIDLAITYFVTTELEDRELTERFGNQYQEYKKKVPKFFPKPKK